MLACTITAVLLVVAFAPTPSAGAAVPVGEATAAAAPVSTSLATTDRHDAAHLTVRIATTSDWTVVKYAPGAIARARLVERTGAAEFRVLADGWKLLPHRGRSASVTLDLVFWDPTGAEEFRWLIQKGYIGATHVTVVNRNRAPVVVLSALNDVQSTEDPANQARWTVAREQFLRPPLTLRKADARKLVLAFYYPWFGRYDDPRLADRPAQPRSTWDPRGVLSMTRQARAHGVDGFIVSWAGERSDGRGFDVALGAAGHAGSLVTGYLETMEAIPNGASEADPVVVERWLRQLLERADSPAFLHHEGTPVVFVWAAYTLPGYYWRDILAKLESDGTPVKLVGDVDDPATMFGYHNYSALGPFPQRQRTARRVSLAVRSRAVLDPREQPRLYAGTVAPGYDDHRFRDGNPVIERGPNGERYRDTWRAALSADPDWIVVTSWNEWFEGTSIEPGVRTGDLALRQTASFSERWRNP